MAPSGQSTRWRHFASDWVFAYKGAELPPRAFDSLCVRWMRWAWYVDAWYVSMRSHKNMVREREIIACITSWNLAHVLEDHAVLHLLAGMQDYIEHGGGHPITRVLKQLEQANSALFSSYTCEPTARIQEKLADMNNASESHKRLVERVDEAAELARDNKRLKETIGFLEARLEQYENPPEAKTGPCSAAAFLAHGIRLGFT